MLRKCSITDQSFPDFLLTGQQLDLFLFVERHAQIKINRWTRRYSWDVYGACCCCCFWYWSCSTVLKRSQARPLGLCWHHHSLLIRAVRAWKHMCLAFLCFFPRIQKKSQGRPLRRSDHLFQTRIVWEACTCVCCVSWICLCRFTCGMPLRYVWLLLVVKVPFLSIPTVTTSFCHIFDERTVSCSIPALMVFLVFMFL